MFVRDKWFYIVLGLLVRNGFLKQSGRMRTWARKDVRITLLADHTMRVVKQDGRTFVHKDVSMMDEIWNIITAALLTGIAQTDGDDVGVLQNIEGQIFGHLTVTSRAAVPDVVQRLSHWKCVCECGALVIVRSDALRNGTVTSCRECRHKHQVQMLFSEFEDGTRK